MFTKESCLIPTCYKIPRAGNNGGLVQVIPGRSFG